MKQRRVSHSPLLDPATCSVLMMAPAAPDLASISPDVPGWQRQTYAAIATAADVLNVPIFTLLWRPDPQGSASGGAPSQASQRLFLLEEYQCPWLDRAFVSALSSEGSSLLVVAGFWLEHEILGTALHALAASYDVAILVDITPARHAPAAPSARERLAQAGATPIVTSQLIREWMVAAPLGSTRATLRALLPTPPSA
jgi:isochorismatase family protein